MFDRATKKIYIDEITSFYEEANTILSNIANNYWTIKYSK